MSVKQAQANPNPSPFDSLSNDLLPPPLVYPLTDNTRLVTMLVALLRESESSIRERMYQEELCMGKCHQEEFGQWDAEPHVWSEGMERYYSECRDYLFELISWNRRPHKLGMRKWIADHLAGIGGGALNILVIGDGLGFDSAHLSSCGHNVSYFELADLSIQFARQLFAMGDSSPHIVGNLTELKDELFDVIVCLDVLEHVPDPPSMVADFATRLRPGGRLIVHAPFFFVDSTCPTHLESNRQYSGNLGLYTKHGFTEVDGRLHWDPLVLIKASPKATAGAVPIFRWLKLRLGGLMLAVGRFWNVPHCCMANRARLIKDSRWLEGLRS